MANEHKRKCSQCGRRTVSRVFYRKVNDGWLWLCPKCWADRQERLAVVVSVEATEQP